MTAEVTLPSRIGGVLSSTAEVAADIPHPALLHQATSAHRGRRQRISPWLDEDLRAAGAGGSHLTVITRHRELLWPQICLQRGSAFRGGSEQVADHDWREVAAASSMAC